MAFDPDAYLSDQTQAGFDPDAYLGKTETESGFDPDSYLAKIKGAGQAVLDYLDLNKEAQAPEQRSFGAKALTAAGTAVQGLVPRSLDQAASMAEYPVKMLPTSIPIETAKKIYDYTQGKPLLEAATENVPVAQRIPEYINAPDSQGRFNAVAGGLLDASMFLPVLHGDPAVAAKARVVEPETPLPVAREPVPETAPPAAEAANPADFESQMVNAVRTPAGKIVGYNVEHGDTISHLSEKYDPSELTSGWVLKRPTRAETDATFIGTDDVQKTNGDFEAAFKQKLQPEPAAATEPPIVTSIKNEITDAQRIAKGLEPAEEFAKADFPGLWDQAKAERAEQPTIGRNLVESINKNPRPLTDAENAHLLQEQVAAEAEHDMAMNNLNRNPGSEDAVARMEAARSYLQDVYNADKSAGRQNSLGLSSRRYMADRELNLARMTQQLQAANKGKPIPEKLPEVQKIHDQMQDIKSKLTDNEKRQKVYQASLKTRINQLEGRMRTGDVSRLTRKPLEDLNEESLNLKARYSKLKSDFDKMVFETQLKNRSVPLRILQTGHEILSVPRAIVASMDLSALRRQGGLFFMSHPLRSLRIFKDTLAATTKHGYFKHLERLKDRPNFKNGTYRQGGLSLTDVSDPKLSHMEEMYANRWTAKLPGVSHSARVYTAFLNQLRAESFDALANSLSRNGAMSKAEKQVIGNFVNVWTGRGALAGRYEPATVALADTFFAPRYIASRFQAIIGQPIWTTRGGFEGTGRVRAAIAKEYARTLIGYGVTYGLLTAGAAAFGKRIGDVVDFNLYSADLGKVKIGNSRLDILSGLAQTTVFSAREIGGKQTNLKGETKDIRGPNVKFKDPTGYDVATRFLRSKLAPVPGLAANLFSGEDYVGNPVGAISSPSTYLNVSGEFPYIGGELPKLVTPLSGGDIYSAIKEQGVPAGAALGLMAIFGDSVQTYSPKISASDLKKLNRPPGSMSGSTPTFLRKPKAEKTIGETQ